MSFLHVDHSVSPVEGLRHSVVAFFQEVVERSGWLERRNSAYAVSRYLHHRGSRYSHLPRRALRRNAHLLAARDGVEL